MVTAQVKRIQMRRGLAGWRPCHNLPEGYRWQFWEEELADIHAGVIYHSFAGTIDAELFPNLGSLSGTRMLLRWLRESPGFCPQATLLIEGPEGPVGAIQSAIEQDTGLVQNVGVLPAARRHGLGSALVARAIKAFQDAGAKQAWLEVTANNARAVRLYRRLGFRAYNNSICCIERART